MPNSPHVAAPGLRIGILFEQFAPYHLDRCAAVARRLAGRGEVLAVEVATTSATYAWAPSGEVAGARKLTLFPGRSYDAVPRWRRFVAQLRALRRCSMVLVGIGYNRPDVIALAAALRLLRIRVVLMTDSKFDDLQRTLPRECLKALLLLPFGAAIVAGARQRAYLGLLGFRRRRIVPGYDTVDTDRVRAMGAAAEAVPFAERRFAFVGRFVDKKALPFLIAAYRRYRDLAGPAAHDLVLVGGGEEEPAVRALIDTNDLAPWVEITGFVQADEVARRLAAALALVLPSREEQWGLVVNEALALGLPVVVTEPVGARDALVRNLVNGFVVEPGSVESLARALLALSDEETWRRMGAASAARAELGDTERLADAVEVLAGAPPPPAMARLIAALDETAAASRRPAGSAAA
ncbi:MAG: glycosyltransferase family 4 protein [Novosphingobium sp.]